MKRYSFFLACGAILFLGCLFFLSLHMTPWSSTILWQIRLPRLANALIVGMLLGLLGTTTQTVFTNPLADTSLTGINAGASLGVAFSLLIIPQYFPSLSWGSTSLVMLGIVGGTLFALGLLLLLKKISQSQHQLLFVGLAFMLFSNALLALLLVWQEEQSMRSFLFWTLGSFQLVGWAQLAIASPLVVIGICWLLKQHKSFDLLLLGSFGAQALGLNTTRFYRVYWCVAALLIGTAMTLAGGIGWVGLIAGHLSRRFLGSQHQQLLPAAAFAGMTLCVWADLFATHLLYPIEIPVGAIISLLGSVLFVYLILKPNHLQRV
jgi:ABC-type Fe3+-siderophore transport system permease subunit